MELITDDTTYFINKDGVVKYEVPCGTIIRAYSKKEVKKKREKKKNTPVEIKGEFVKSMCKLDDLVIEQLTKEKKPILYLVLNVLKKYIEPNTNILKKCGQKLLIKDIAEDMGISRQSAESHIKELREKGLIAKVKIKRTEYLVLNPNLYVKSVSVPKYIYELFER